MTVKALLAANPHPTEDEIRRALSGNLCRCTGYSQMYQAVKAAIKAEQKGSRESQVITRQQLGATGQ
jgi:carbon-monoxide dehydrogenase small subunit